jgi:hypothetical protein
MTKLGCCKLSCSLIIFFADIEIESLNMHLLHDQVRAVGHNPVV